VAVKRLVWLAVFALVGGVVAWLVVPARRVETAAPTTATLDGHPLPLQSYDAAITAAREDARAWLESTVTVVVGTARVARTREQLGAGVDEKHLEALVREATDPTSALRVVHGRTQPAQALALAIPYAIDSSVTLAALMQMKDELDVAPVDAKYDFRTRELSPDQPGRSIDAWATFGKLDDALASGAAEVQAVVTTSAAARPATRFQGVSTDAILGWFETKYARDLKHEARTFNLRLAASKLDGYVLLPGETFDFNTVVGPRSEAMGYKIAPVIAQGELVDGIGGGTCQVAGTLHAASFFAGLELGERKPHTRPSFYIKMGLDAAVAYPTVTLQLGNPFPFPVVFHETVEHGVVRAEILGPVRTKDVTFGRKIDKIVAFPEKEIPDPSIPKGDRELKQRGIPGLQITRWRIVRDGPFAVREHHQDYYPPTTQIWKVGTGAPDPKFEADDDAHPEYVADEYLFISQGADIKGPHGSDMVESRIPGKTGSYGWTVREGFAKETHGTHAKGTNDKDTESKEGVD
jgi:vancomycin resistance protein YoaR